LPLEEFSRPGWLLYLARNDEARGPTPPIIEIRRQTAPGSYRPARHTPLQRVERVLAAGNEIRTELDDDSYAELHELWGPTFGWRRDEEEDNITAFAERLQSEQAMPESERTTWFAATYSGGLLVSAAMAERLEIPGPDGPLDLVESTEWCTRPGEDYRGHGFMAATLTAINAQVLHSLRDSPRGQPLIYAETNFTARSDRAGHAVGLRIPSREYARQILAQNVTVADGIATAGLRDFSFMYLAEQIRALHYDTEQTGRLISALEAGVRA
jgi:hypothetical protein